MTVPPSQWMLRRLRPAGLGLASALDLSAVGHGPLALVDEDVVPAGDLGGVLLRNERQRHGQAAQGLAPELPQALEDPRRRVGAGRKGSGLLEHLPLNP